MQDTAVINMSLGGPASPELDQVVQDAAAQGVELHCRWQLGADADLYLLPELETSKTLCHFSSRQRI